MKATRRILEPSALELVEEAVHMLRRAPAGTLIVYYAGTVPWVLALLFFWAHATWFQPTGDQLAWGALGLVVLFAAMKAAQVEFCARLMASRLGAPPPPWSWRRFRRVAATQLRLQPWALGGSIIAAIITAPFGWVYAYSQNLVVMGEAEELHREAVGQAKLWPAQNHLGLLMISLLSLGVWVNLGAAFIGVPWLANKLLGIENIFGFSGWWYFNTTFVASVTALTWLAVDPLVKTFYVLRVFHGRARRTGEDIRVELNLARSARHGLRAIALLVVLLTMTRVEVHGAETPARKAGAVQPAELDRSIEEVLAGPEFTWRLRPNPAREPKAPESAFKRFIRQGVDLLVEMARSVGRFVRKIVDWFDGFFGGEKSSSTSTSGGAGAAAITVLRMLLYVFIAVAVILILWVLWLVVRAQPRGAAVVAAQPVAAAAPDLRDENVQAAQLPADGWLALAREQVEKGEWRLALRALYLATLARLAAEGLVALARFKTNLDYEREVRRRALSRTEVVTGFARRRREFEDVWYGRGIPAEANVRAWMAEMERSR